MNAKIVFNGKEYDSVDEMPAEARQAYEQAMSVFADQNQNGTPDIFEGRGPTQVIANIFADKDGDGTPDVFEAIQGGAVSQAQTIIYEGKVYDSVDELPAEARQKYEAARGKVGAAFGNLTGSANPVPTANTGHDAGIAWMESLAARQKQPAEPLPLSDPLATFSNDVVQPDTGNRRLLLLLALLVIVVMGGIVMFMLVQMR